MQIEKEIKALAKEQRLKRLRALYFELQMDMAAYEANNDQEEVERTRNLMESAQKSYAAIAALPVDDV